MSVSRTRALTFKIFGKLWDVLVDTDRSHRRSGLDGSSDSPSLCRNRGAFYIFGLERFDGGLQIVAHQVEPSLESFVLARVAVGGMKGDLRGWQREYQPSAASIHGTKLQDVVKERSIRVRILAVEQDMGAENHGVIVS
jgi:hypothetical protein